MQLSIAAKAHNADSPIISDVVLGLQAESRQSGTGPDAVKLGAMLDLGIRRPALMYDLMDLI